MPAKSATKKLQAATKKATKPDVEVPIRNTAMPAQDLGVAKVSKQPVAYQGHDH